MSRSRTLNSFSWSLVILLVKDNKSIFRSNCSNCETNMKLGTVTDYGSNLKNWKRPYPKTARKSRNWWRYQKLVWRKSSSKPVILYTKWKLLACRSNFTKVIHAKNKLYFPSIYSSQLYKKMSSCQLPSQCPLRIFPTIQEHPLKAPMKWLLPTTSIGENISFLVNLLKMKLKT